jgi:hypothetical protein
MAETDVTQPGLDWNPENVVAPQKQHDCAAPALSAYAAAIKRSPKGRDAFDAAVRTYLLYHPNMPEEAARLAVARIISSKE